MRVNELLRAMFASAALLAVFALAGTALVAVTELGTRERIADNEREHLLRTLNVLVPRERYDNDLFGDTIEVHAPEALGTPESITVYRAAHGERAVALVLTAVAPDGYSGAIRMLVGINADGTLAGVRVLSHRETPGLGDDIELRRSDWILGFDGRSLDNPPRERWGVQRDGGDFDQFTGATITPRAVVGAVKRALVYFEAEREQLFAPYSVP